MTNIFPIDLSWERCVRVKEPSFGIRISFSRVMDDQKVLHEFDLGPIQTIHWNYLPLSDENDLLILTL